MIKYILLTLLLLYFISKICYTEYFENKLSEYSININRNSDKTKCHSYKFYNNNTLLVESDICKWNKIKNLKSKTTHNFNNNFDEVEIKKGENEYTYYIILDGKKKQTYKVEKDDFNIYNIFDMNSNKLYSVYRNILDNKETITIRNNKFDRYAVINNDTNVYNNLYPSNMKFSYKTTSPNFNNQEILGYSIFKLIQEINRDVFN